MRQQLLMIEVADLKAERARLRHEMESLKTDRDEWKTLAQALADDNPETVTGETLGDMVEAQQKARAEQLPKSDPMEEALSVPLGETLDSREGGKVDYNGWSNRETWQAAVFVGSHMDQMAEEGDPVSPEEAASLIDELLPYIEPGSLLENIVDDWKLHANTKELAKHYGWKP